MRFLSRLLLLLFSSLLSLTIQVAHAGSKTDLNCNQVLGAQFAIARDGWPLYYENYKVKNSKGQIVISNGLIYELKNYNELIQELNQKGYSVLVYAHRAQHQSFEKARSLGLKLQKFTLDDLAEDLKDLLAHLKFKKPVHLVGLSYGSSVAARFAEKFSSQVKTLSLWAPLIELAPEYKASRRMSSWFSIWGAGSWYQRSSDEVEAMIDAIEDFDLKKITFKQPAFLILAEKEESYLLRQQYAFYEDILKKQSGSLLMIEGAQHALPSVAPEALATAFEQLINQE